VARLAVGDDAAGEELCEDWCMLRLSEKTGCVFTLIVPWLTDGYHGLKTWFLQMVLMLFAACFAPAVWDGNASCLSAPLASAVFLGGMQVNPLLEHFPFSRQPAPNPPIPPPLIYII
jgi:hypothetical protein